MCIQMPTLVYVVPMIATHVQFGTHQSGPTVAPRAPMLCRHDDKLPLVTRGQQCCKGPSKDESVKEDIHAADTAGGATPMKRMPWCGEHQHPHLLMTPKTTMTAKTTMTPLTRSTAHKSGSRTFVRASWLERMRRRSLAVHLLGIGSLTDTDALNVSDVLTLHRHICSCGPRRRHLTRGQHS